MNLPKSKKDITIMAAEEAGISRNKMLFIVREFEKALRRAMADPLNTGKSIKIHEFAHFDIREYRFNEYLKDKNLDYMPKRDRDVYELLNGKYERQAEDAGDNAGSCNQ